MKKKKILLTVLDNLELAIAGVILVALVSCTFVGVFARYLFGVPFNWLEEMQQAAMVWIAFLVAGAAFRRESHVAIEIVVDSLPKKIGGLIERFDVLLQLLILGYLCYQEFTYYFQLISTGKVTNLLRIPYSVAYLALPIGGVLMLVSMLWASYQQFVKGVDLKGGETE